MILGNVDLIQRSAVIGWAMNLKHKNAALEISIRVNGETVAVGKTGYSRPDILRLYGGPDTGFKIPIPAAVLMANQSVKVEAFIGESKVPGSILLPPRTFFMHIPKTGGSTLREMLEPLFDEYSIFPDAYQMRRHGGKYPPLVAGYIHQDELSYLRLVRGHFGWSEIRLFEDRPQIVTVLRDPVQRMVSHLKHFFRRKSGTMDGALFQQFLKENAGRLINQFSNLQCRMIGETDSGDWSRTNKPNLKVALNRLDEIDHLFTTKDLDTISDYFARAWGIPLSQAPRRNSSHDQFAVPEAMLAEIQSQNEADLELYNAAALRSSH